MNKIIYCNGEEARVGDIVWTREGSHVCKVLKVVSPEQAQLLYYENEGGILVARHIGSFDLGPLFFMGQQWFKQEWIYPVAQEDMREIERLYRLLGESLNINIWGNPNYAYYPVLNVEEIEGKDEETWYLFFQPSHDAPHTLETEQCYWFNKKNNRFEKLSRSLLREMRGMVEPGGGGPLPEC